jgi:anti-sigma regulatory factor (Ser/Thr protein kinase)
VRFDPETAFNSVTNPEEILANHGRGLTMMRAYCDSVDYSFHNPGNKVTLIKRNLSENDNS